MTLLRRPPRGRSDDGAAGLRSIGPLDDTERHPLRRLVERDPIVNAVLAARLDSVTSLSARRLGGTVLGVRDTSGDLVAATFHGGNLLPVAGDDAAWTALGRRLASENRSCSSIVGPADAVQALWRELEPSWGVARAVRDRQPLLRLDDAAHLGDADPEVAPVLLAQLDAYVPAAAAMFTEELGVPPYRGTHSGEYRRRVGALIRERRAFARFDDRGEVVFKADLGAVSRHTSQVQGVWVRPDLRGRGIGTRGLAAVLGHALQVTPTVSLYVNDYNTPARRMYDRLGMREVGTLATVLF